MTEFEGAEMYSDSEHDTDEEVLKKILYCINHKIKVYFFLSPLIVNILLITAFA